MPGCSKAIGDLREPVEQGLWAPVALPFLWMSRLEKCSYNQQTKLGYDSELIHELIRITIGESRLIHELKRSSFWKKCLSRELN